MNNTIQELINKYFQCNKEEKDQYLSILINNFPTLDCKWKNIQISNEILHQRLSKLQQIQDKLLLLSQKEEIPFDLLLANAWKFYIPYAYRIINDYNKIKSNNENNNLPLIYGLLGVQGAGKTTLGIIMKIILESEGIQLDCISIDKEGPKNRSLFIDSIQQNKVDRGPPGTHDIQLAKNTFENARQSWYKYLSANKNESQVKATEPEIIIPQFDKSLHQGQGDRVDSKVIKKPEIIIFEGWFLGYRFNSNINQLLKEKKLSKEDQQFAVDMNDKLQEYHCLWDLLEELLILMPEKFEYSIQWRMEAEQKMRKIKGSGKTDQEIEAFVKYFFLSLDPEIFINDLILKKQAKLVAKVNYSHEIIDCFEN